MNERLYNWTSNFHKVVRQQNSGAVADFILPYSAVYLRIHKWKNYWNPSTFAKLIVKIKVARFYGPLCTLIKIKTRSIQSGEKERRAFHSDGSTVKLLINAPGVYLNTDLKTPAFNRDPAFIGDPASIRTLASRPLHLLMSVFPISPVYVNFTLHMLLLSVFIYFVS